MTDRVDRLGLEFAAIPPGEYLQGSMEDDQAGAAVPVRRLVRLTRPFHFQVAPVTVAQFRAFLASEGHDTSGPVETWADGAWRTNATFDSVNQRDQAPVVGVSYHDASAFLRWLSQGDGRPYRLPTEAEFEYCAHAGCACVADCAAVTRLPAGSFRSSATEVRAAPLARSGPPNPWGFYGMNGGIWHWCSDWFAPYDGTATVDPRGPDTPPDETSWRGHLLGPCRVIRGGSFSYGPAFARCSNRHLSRPGDRNFNLGFRAVF